MPDCSQEFAGLNIPGHIYAQDVPVIEPSEQEKDFPEYPGAVFRPLESAYFLSGPCTSDVSVEKVTSNFDEIPGPKTHFMEMAAENFRIKKTDNPGYHFWPALKTSHQPGNWSAESASYPPHTIIIYKDFIDLEIIKDRL
jgi:hypothetical protein